MAILEVKDLEVCYGVIQAIKGISFEVNQGEIIALIGANGAGKRYHKDSGLQAGRHGNCPRAGGTPRVRGAVRSAELKAGRLHP